ncbi:hypothetical protein B0H17DRAFT_1078317, partial [Mycena rosella]
MDRYEMYHRSSSPHEYPPPPQQPRTARQSDELIPTARRIPPQPQYADTQPQHNSSTQHPSDLARLTHLLKAEHLLTDLDVDALADKYAHATDKWKACSREEWAAGADDLTVLYTRIFDFAKKHMTSKLHLFTTCDARLAVQHGLLADRDALLDGAKEQLVEESERVLDMD